MEHDETPSIWQAAVNLGHLVIALIGLLALLGGFLLTNERRFTIVEERQAFVLKHIADDAQDAAAFRIDMIRRLDSMALQLTNMTIELARHQAQEEMRQGVGLRPPNRVTNGH